MKFDRIVVINLDRKPDAWHRFVDGIPQSFALGEFTRQPAIDGQRVKPPAWWRSGAGAWGCYRSHLATIESALNDGIESLLIFEEDAIFSDEFNEQSERFFAGLPADWGWIYLGGQHYDQKRFPPVAINDHVTRGLNIHRTHAYGIRGLATLQRIYHWLTRLTWQSDRDDPHHIDKQYGLLHQHGEIPAYCPAKFIVGQREGHSSIAGADQGERWWNAWAPASGQSPLVAVMGQFRGGTSCVAGVLHRLGVSMGARFESPQSPNPKGFYEASQLAAICRAAYREPWMTEQLTREQRINRLRQWGNSRRVACGYSLNGGKHPALCLMGAELQEAWGNVRWVAVDRPVAESIRSIRSLGWGWPAKAAESVLPRMADTRDEWLRSVDRSTVLRVDYHELIADPVRIVDDVIEFFELEPTEEQIRDAIAFVDPKLKTVAV